MMDTPFFDDPHQAELAEALGFTPDDLYQNQKGELTREQYERVMQKQSLNYEFVSNLLQLLGFGAYFFMLFTSYTLGGLFVFILWVIGIKMVNYHLMLKCYGYKRRQHVFWTTVKMPAHRLFFRPSVRREGRWLYFPHKLRRKLVPGQTYNVYFVPVKVNKYGCYIVGIEPTGDSLYLEKYAKRKRKRSPDKSKRAA